MTYRLPEDARTELDRVARRWQQLPLAAAAGAAAEVLDVAQQLADAAGERPRAALPDLGPGSVIHQLEVCAYDAARAGVPVATVTAALTSLRRRLP